jgi:hypothetical protein
MTPTQHMLASCAFLLGLHVALLLGPSDRRLFILSTRYAQRHSLHAVHHLPPFTMFINVSSKSCCVMRLRRFGGACRWTASSMANLSVRNTLGSSSFYRILRFYVVPPQFLSRICRNNACFFCLFTCYMAVMTALPSCAHVTRRQVQRYLAAGSSGHLERGRISGNVRRTLDLAAAPRILDRTVHFPL